MVEQCIKYFEASLGFQIARSRMLLIDLRSPCSGCQMLCHAPIPSPEVSQSLPVEASLAVGADRNFSLKAIHSCSQAFMGWSDYIWKEVCILEMDSNCVRKCNGVWCGSTSDFVWLYGICWGWSFWDDSWCSWEQGVKCSSFEGWATLAVHQILFWQGSPEFRNGEPMTSSRLWEIQLLGFRDLSCCLWVLQPTSLVSFVVLRFVNQSGLMVPSRLTMKKGQRWDNVLHWQLSRSGFLGYWLRTFREACKIASCLGFALCFSVVAFASQMGRESLGWNLRRCTSTVKWLDSWSALLSWENEDQLHTGALSQDSPDCSPRRCIDMSSMVACGTDFDPNRVWLAWVTLARCILSCLLLPWVVDGFRRLWVLLLRVSGFGTCYVEQKRSAVSGSPHTHSLKATLLAWSSKAGLSHDDRRLLGYHMSSSDASLLVHSRDAMAGPLRSLCQLISQVVSGEFNPDATRSGLFIPRPGDAELEASDLSSLGSEDEDDADVFEEEKAVEDVAGRWQPDDVKDGCTYFRHSSSRCIHKTMDEAGSAFACGRSISVRYEREAERPKIFHPLCGTCFRGYHAWCFDMNRKKECFMCGSGPAVSFHVISWGVWINLCEGLCIPFCFNLLWMSQHVCHDAMWGLSYARLRCVWVDTRCVVSAPVSTCRI